MATVDIQAVSKSYNNNLILDNINLNIEKGTFVAVVGPSGSGKSTLLRLVAGLDTLCSGRILINNQCVNEMPAAKRNMAMVFQHYALYPHMTVFANMAYGLKMRKVPKKEIRERVESVSELLQISDYLYRKPTQLSGGQRQRVAMGRAIVRNPAVFLFDEPLSNLDAKLRTEMRHEIKKLHQKLRTTCLYVTHDQIEAMTLADIIVVLKDGKIEQIGSPRTLYQQPASRFVASFIGHYPMNFISANWDKNAQQLITEAGLTYPLLNKMADAQSADILIGIRPEHVLVHDSQGPGRIAATIQLIDDMGSDRLLQVKIDGVDVILFVRVTSDISLSGEKIFISFRVDNINLFCQHTHKRLGGLNG